MNADNFGNSISSSSNDGMCIIAGTECTSAVFIHDHDNQNHIHMLINQPEFDLKCDNNKFGDILLEHINGNRILIGLLNYNLQTGSIISNV